MDYMYDKYYEIQDSHLYDHLFRREGLERTHSITMIDYYCTTEGARFRRNMMLGTYENEIVKLTPEYGKKLINEGKLIEITVKDLSIHWQKIWFKEDFNHICQELRKIY
jgi:hypothetical protein